MTDMETKYWQLVYSDPEFLPGITVSQAIAYCSSISGCIYVVVDEVEGRGLTRGKLVFESPKTYHIEMLMELLNEMKQLEWGMFYFTDSIEQAEGLLSEREVTGRLGYSSVALRCVDNCYLYFYTSIESHKDCIQSQYRLEGIDLCPLSRLVFPY